MILWCFSNKLPSAPKAKRPLTSSYHEGTCCAGKQLIGRGGRSYKRKKEKEGEGEEEEEEEEMNRDIPARMCR